jgi:phosphomannomutase
MIQFGTGGWRAVIGDGFTRSNIQKIAAALGRRIRREGVQREICIGYDRRFLSREAAIWFSEAITGEGVKVDFINLSCPTPQVMYTVKKWNLPYGAAITASHNPALYNGVKLFTKGGRDAGQDVTDAIQDEANAMSDVDVHLSDFKECLRAGAISFIDPRDDYLDSILARVDTSAIRRRRPRIVIDPMYGVSLTGLMTILYSSRCDVDVIHDTHDAFFGRRLPAPTLDTLADLQRQVLEHNADLGIATDGDADRLGVIDERGRYISANLVLVLLYYYLLKYKGWKGAAVRNVATTHLLDRVAEKFGEQCIEVPVGFKHVSAAMQRTDALIGGESSGGLTVRGHIFGKDGLYAASLLVEMLSVTGKPLSAMVEDIYREFGELHVAERDWPLTEAGKAEINAKVFDRHGLPDFGIPMAKVSWMDGCKVWFGSEEAAKSDGWLILRFSGTEPRLRIFAEAGTMGEAEALVDIMARYVGLKN